MMENKKNKERKDSERIIDDQTVSEFKCNIFILNKLIQNIDDPPFIILCNVNIFSTLVLVVKFGQETAMSHFGIIWLQSN